jgi:hypothetical protein
MPKPTKPDRAPGEPVTTDPRFSVIHTDPRFARPRRKDVKIPLDSRFKAAFKDKEFTDQRMFLCFTVNRQQALTDMAESWPKTRGSDS